MKNISFVVGGAASGKSAFAERLTRSTGKPKTYIATLQPFDDEMRAKAQRHQSDRGDDWTTIEAPIDVGTVLRNASPDQVILLGLRDPLADQHPTGRTRYQCGGDDPFG